MEQHSRFERPYSALKNKAVDKKVEEDGDDDVEEEEGGCGDGELGFEIDEKKKKIVVGGGSGRRGFASGGGGASLPRCQVEKCASDLTDAKRYHRRHKVCEVHAKATAVIVAGLRQRFCQQCSRFHELSEFDEAKRSCRKRLAGHNERRRKSSSESQGEGSSRRGLDPQLKENQCWQTDERGRAQITFTGNPTLKHFQIR